jgi:hypothetical protein
MIIKENSSKSNDYEPIAKGRHEAICVTVAGIGEQETSYGVKNQVIVTWEIPSIVREWTKDGETQEGRAQISRTFTCSLAPKASLRLLLESWRDREFTHEELQGFDISKLLGVPCILKIKHQTSADGTKIYANIADIEPSENKEKTEPEAKLVSYDPYNHDADAFSKLPDWIANKVAAPTSEGLTHDPIPEPIKERIVEEVQDMPF